MAEEIGLLNNEPPFATVPYGGALILEAQIFVRLGL